MRLPPLRKFFTLPAARRRLITQAFLLLALIRLGLWLLPFRTLQGALERMFPQPRTATEPFTSIRSGDDASSPAQAKDQNPPIPQTGRIVTGSRASSVPAIEPFSSAVCNASPYVPSATCLTQALALRALLAHAGIPSTLAIGVARGDASGIAAHAWLEVDGDVVIGEGGMERYTRMENGGQFSG